MESVNKNEKKCVSEVFYSTFQVRNGNLLKSPASEIDEKEI